MSCQEDTSAARPRPLFNVRLVIPPRALGRRCAGPRHRTDGNRDPRHGQWRRPFGYAFDLARLSASSRCQAARTSVGRRWRGTPFLGGNVSNGLGERPAVAPNILHDVLPLAKGHVRRRLQDSRTTLPGILEMLVNVLNMHVQVLAYFVGAGRPKLSTLAAQHDGALG